MFLSGGLRTGRRPLITCLAAFAGMALVISVMGLERGGLTVVDTRLGGLRPAPARTSITRHLKCSLRGRASIWTRRNHDEDH